VTRFSRLKHDDDKTGRSTAAVQRSGDGQNPRQRLRT
jgi:hypothetical protein